MPNIYFTFILLSFHLGKLNFIGCTKKKYKKEKKISIIYYCAQI